MAVDHIRYDLLAQEALRGVVRRVLIDVAKTGLPGEHHLYISFDTRAPGVRLSDRMREKYPEQMTIVLQHQFWDLKVTEEAFEVGLSFGGVPERLLIPFDALTGFFDPSVQFGLQFELSSEAAAAETAEPAPATTSAEPSRPRRAPRARPADATAKASEPPGETPPAPAASTPDATPAAADAQPQPDAPSGGAQVVKFDRFRKKK